MGNLTGFLGGVFDKISQNFLVRLIINSNLCAGTILTPPSCFSFNNSRTVKAVDLEFATLSDFSLETSMASLVFLTCSSLQIFDKTRTRVFLVSGFLLKSLINKNYLSLVDL